MSARFEDPLKCCSDFRCGDDLVIDNRPAVARGTERPMVYQWRISWHNVGKAKQYDRLVNISLDGTVPSGSLQALKPAPCTDTTLPHQRSCRQIAPLTVYFASPNST